MIVSHMPWEITLALVGIGLAIHYGPSVARYFRSRLTQTERVRDRSIGNQSGRDTNIGGGHGQTKAKPKRK